jgi:outer membrane immunogenic protein
MLEASAEAPDGAGGGALKARLYLLSTVSALAISGAASAADMPLKAPPPAPVISWAGPYIGLHGGVGWLNASQTVFGTIGFPTCSTVAGVACDVNATGAVFGGQLGYNWQMNSWVFGVEADSSWAGLKSTVTFSHLHRPFLTSSMKRSAG